MEVGPLVTGFFKALESYDQLLYGALRDKTFPTAEEVDARIEDVDAAFERLLATVPADILDRAKRVLEVATEKSGRASRGAADPADTAAADGPDTAVVDDEAAELVMLLR
jgi:hypothetical protein